MRVQPHFFIAIGQNDNGSLMGLRNQFREVPLRFANSQLFHVSKLSQFGGINKPKRLYRPLSRRGNPRLSRLNAVLSSLGLKVRFHPRSTLKPCAHVTVKGPTWN